MSDESETVAQLTARIEGMKKTAFRCFKERLQFPIDSPEWQERFALVRTARQAIRDLERQLRGEGDPPPDTELCTFEFDSKTADLIEWLAADSGKTTQEFLLEVMQTALWNGGRKDGIKVYTTADIRAAEEAARLKSAAAIEADRAASDTPFLEAQARGIAFAATMLRDAADAIREDCGRTSATLPESELARLQEAITAAEDAAAALRTRVDALDWTQPAKQRGYQIEQRPAGRGYHMQVFRERELMARVILPPEITISQARAIGGHLAEAMD